MDFEEPKRLRRAEAAATKKIKESTVTPEANAPREREEEVEIPVERITENIDVGPLAPKMRQLNVGPEPLRLLPCRYVFHVRGSEDHHRVNIMKIKPCLFLSWHQ
jgi:hypothetical protein